MGVFSFFATNKKQIIFNANQYSGTSPLGQGIKLKIGEIYVAIGKSSGENHDVVAIQDFTGPKPIEVTVVTSIINYLFAQAATPFLSKLLNSDANAFTKDDYEVFTEEEAHKAGFAPGAPVYLIVDKYNLKKLFAFLEDNQVHLSQNLKALRDSLGQQQYQKN